MNLPPLVEPAPELSVDEVRRYSRHLIIPDVGMTGQKRLKNAKVLCVGAGGLGSPALMYLAAAGVGTLGIAEFDTVDESNLQRQIIHGQKDIGRSKAESARDRVLEINPYVNVQMHEVHIDSTNVMEIFSEYDLIVDGTDNFATRYLAGQMPTMEMAQDPAIQNAMLAFLLMQLPLSLMFWHAPALVHWHQVPPAKSVFFSLVACLRNFWAFTVFGLAWMAILIFTILAVSLFAGLLGSPEVAGLVLLPAAMLVAAMFFTSTYFSFRDCFDTSADGAP